MSLSPSHIIILFLFRGIKKKTKNEKTEFSNQFQFSLAWNESKPENPSLALEVVYPSADSSIEILGRLVLSLGVYLAEGGVIEIPSKWYMRPFYDDIL